MFGIILALCLIAVILVIVQLAIVVSEDDIVAKWVYSIVLWIIGPFCLFLLVFFPIVSIFVPLGDGVMPNYSVGTYYGQITTVETGGIIWKTTEVEMNLGIGEQTAIPKTGQQPLPKGRGL